MASLGEIYLQKTTPAGRPVARIKKKKMVVETQKEISSYFRTVRT